jgi:Ca-activated chloride channel family protein
MLGLFNRFWNVIPKPLLFGLLAAVGCLIGAILGEVWLAATQPPPPPPPPSNAVSLLIDTSGSMDGAKLQEVKSAAMQFIQRRNSSNLSNLSQDSIAVVGFGDNAYVAAALTNNLTELEQPINQLLAKGSTKMDLGLQVASQQLPSSSTGINRSILLFTDGQPDDRKLTLDAGQSAKSQGIRIVAVATNDADINLLSQIAGNSSLVFSTNIGSFEQAFQKAEEAIYRDVLNPNATPIDPNKKPSQEDSLRRIGVWTALLSLGAGLALIISQNIYLRSRLLKFIRQGSIGFVGCLAVGFVAGTGGQLLYAVAPNLLVFSPGETSRIIVAWTILGALLGLGLAFFVPNLNPAKALLGGIFGGIFGAIGFWLAVAVYGPYVARLLGAAILGFFIGLMIALLELVQEASLVVHWGPKEKSIIGLGVQPIILGSSDQAHIYLPKEQNFPPIYATICLKRGKIEFENKLNGQQQMLKNGSKLNIGHLTIEIKSSK